MSERRLIEHHRASVHRRRVLGVLAGTFGRCENRDDWGRRGRAVAELLAADATVDEIQSVIAAVAMEQKRMGGSFTEMAVVHGFGRYLHFARKRREGGTFAARVFEMAGVVS